MSSSSAKPTHVTESLSDKRKERELAEARQAGTAAPEIDVKTGTMINPHNPAFLVKRPWYLSGEDAGPSLDHLADQRADSERVELSLSSADAIVRAEREKLRAASKGGFKALRRGMWVEALKRNRKPYLMCQVKAIDKKKKAVDLEYEDGYVERGVRWSSRIRITKVGARAMTSNVDSAVVGKETYDSKRDAYHGIEADEQQKMLHRKFAQRDSLRKERRSKELHKEAEAEAEAQEEAQAAKAGNKGKVKASAASDSDSDSDYDSDAGSDSDDEFVQRDADAKTFTSRLARQGGVGGAQMKVTARNLRIREDTAKYLRNLDPNSAYYDPKSRSMRDNPYEGVNPDEVAFAGDNYARISGDAVGLAQTQVFAWDAEGKGVQEIHPQANPSQAELLKKQFTTQSTDLKLQRKNAVLDKYGGLEYLDGTDGLGSAALDRTVNGGGAGGGAAGRSKKPDKGALQDPEQKRRERQVRFGASSTMEEYTRDGRLVKHGAGAAGGGGASSRASTGPVRSKYEEDVFQNGHRTVFGSFFHRGAFRWGYADDHSLMKNSYCTGENGRRANDEANELRYGDGREGSAQVAQLRQMLGAGALTSKKDASISSIAPPTSSKMYGEADQFAALDKSKVKEALAKQEKVEKQFERSDRKRGYNSIAANSVDVTEEEMEAYRLKKGRGTDDPMAKLKDDEVLDYK